MVRTKEPEPDNPSHQRQQAHAYSTSHVSLPQKTIADATKTIELNPNHHMGYGHCGIAYTLLSTPDCQKALVDIERSIELHPVHHAEAYTLCAVIHEYLGNHAAAERGHKLGR